MTTPAPEAYQCVADGECVFARYLRIYKTASYSSDIINLIELVVWSSAFPDVNLAAGKDVTCSPACHSLATGSRLVDGATNTDIVHTCFEGNSDSRGGLAAGACASTVPKSMEIDLGQEYLIDGMLIVNRLDSDSRTRIQDVKVDFKDADGTVVLTTAAITSEANGHDGYVMDLTKEGDRLNGAGEFDAWKYIPRGDVVQAANFDWTPYRRWCAVDEYWDGAACRDCPVATTSPGGAATVCCAADEYADGSACVTCPAGSMSVKHVMCTCDANEYWDGTSCAACPGGSFSAGGAETTASCTTCATTEYWNSDRCRTCPTGSTGTGDGTLCVCDANEYWAGSACQACPVGSFSAGGNATSTSCTSCSIDEYWDGSACQACPVGSFNPDSTTCKRKPLISTGITDCSAVEQAFSTTGGSHTMTCTEGGSLLVDLTSDNADVYLTLDTSTLTYFDSWTTMTWSGRLYSSGGSNGFVVDAPISDGDSRAATFCYSSSDTCPGTACSCGVNCPYQDSNTGDYFYSTYTYEAQDLTVTFSSPGSMAQWYTWSDTHNKCGGSGGYIELTRLEIS